VKNWRGGVTPPLQYSSQITYTYLQSIVYPSFSQSINLFSHLPIYARWSSNPARVIKFISRTHSKTATSQHTPSKMTTATSYVSLNSAQLFTKTWIVRYYVVSLNIACDSSDCITRFHPRFQRIYRTLRPRILPICGPRDKNIQLGSTWLRKKCHQKE
jgi:hypothetical protein